MATSYQYKLPVEVQLIHMANRKRSSMSMSLKATSSNSPRTAAVDSPAAAAPPPLPPPGAQQPQPKQQEQQQRVVSLQDGQKGQQQPPPPPPPPLPPPPPPPPPQGQQQKQQELQKEELQDVVKGQEGQQGQLDGAKDNHSGEVHGHDHHHSGPQGLVEEALEVVGSTRFRCVLWAVVVKGVVSTLYMFVLVGYLVHGSACNAVWSKMIAVHRYTSLVAWTQLTGSHQCFTGTNSCVLVGLLIHAFLPADRRCCAALAV